MESLQMGEEHRAIAGLWEATLSRGSLRDPTSEGQSPDKVSFTVPDTRLCLIGPFGDWHALIGPRRVPSDTPRFRPTFPSRLDTN